MRTAEARRLPGDDGSWQTLGAMAAVVDAAAVSDRFRAVVARLRDAGVDSPGAVWAWLKRTHVFKDDPQGYEIIDDPLLVLDPAADNARDVRRRWLGDCDDHAVIGAAVGKALGFDVAFGVCNRRGPEFPFGHVLWGVVDRGGEFHPMDSQEAEAPGVWPKWVTRRAVYRW